MKTAFLRAGKIVAVQAIAVMFAGALAGAAQMLTGAGATFPYPIYSKWFHMYHEANPEVRINYQSIGSGGGIRQATDRTVDFGATDAPMTSRQQFKAGTILHVPTVIGSVIPIFNLPGVKDLNLTGEILVDIYLGKITSWNDPAILAVNGDRQDIPGAPITVVRRADGSGTTYCFVDYLSKISKEWEKKVGRSTSVEWPVGLGAKGNEGVAGMVKQTPYAIGYAELIYAKQNGITYAAVKNAAGNFVLPDLASMTAAADAVKMPADFKVSITNAPGEKSYPISTFTWLLVYEKNPGGKGKALSDFLRWMLKEGQAEAHKLGYAPLPDGIKKMVEETIKKIK